MLVLKLSGIQIYLEYKIGHDIIIINNSFYTQVVDNRRIIKGFFWSIMNHY